MKASVTALLLAVALSAACATVTSVSDAPEWVTALIQELEAQPVTNPPAFIARYEYQGQTVYYRWLVQIAGLLKLASVRRTQTASLFN